MDDERVTSLEKVFRHGFPHDSEADESDPFTHVSLLLVDSPAGGSNALFETTGPITTEKHT
jgi:hypothetical protein